MSILRFSIDDGYKSDLRIADLLEEYDFKLNATFYIAPDLAQFQVPIDNMKIAKKLVERGFEIGGHTSTHQLLSGLHYDAVSWEVRKGIYELESGLGIKITKFAYPKGWFDDTALQVVRDLRLEGRTVKMGITDISGYSREELPLTAHIYPRDEYARKGIAQSVIDLYEKSKTEGYFNLLMHSWELDRRKLWTELETVLKYLHNDKVINNEN